MVIVGRLALLLGACVAGCAAGPGPQPSAAPETAQQAGTRPAVPAPTPPLLIPHVRLVADTNAVPPFSDTALISWGAEPPGTVHVLPPHDYDLQHQSVRVRFWGVRALALRTLMGFPADSIARAAILAIARVSDSRIRQSAVGALSSFPGPDTERLLRTVARSDASPIVRGIALASYLEVARDAALPVAGEVMSESSWRDVLRAPAMAVLKGMRSDKARALYQKYVKQQ